MTTALSYRDEDTLHIVTKLSTSVAVGDPEAHT